MKSSSHILALALLFAGACAQSDVARVERYENGAYRPEPVRDYRISGARDGAATNATAVFTLENGDVLGVHLRVTYNPTPVLAEGHWQLDRGGATGDVGEVREESLKFLGGQGSAPSVGGRFRLERNGETRWRVVMPSRPLARD